MVAVFAGFASGELTELQQMGFGLGLAVLMDATIVRTVLVPASMRLLGDWNWYLPRWLRWLPELRVETTKPATDSPPRRAPLVTTRSTSTAHGMPTPSPSPKRVRDHQARSDHPGEGRGIAVPSPR